jgi:hypothetical protein
LLPIIGFAVENFGLVRIPAGGIMGRAYSPHGFNVAQFLGR